MPSTDITVRRFAYGLGATLALVMVGFLLLPGSQLHLAPGPANRGHETLSCIDCHIPAPGNVRQQVQANVQHLLGRRSEGAAFIHCPISNDQCQACHRNETDRHAPYRFNEPRFEQVRRDLAPHECVSCHREHTGRRVTVAPGFCVHCHQDLAVAKDPASPTHEELLRMGQWDACLRCHDYHSNHNRITPRHLPSAIADPTLLDYLGGGPSPYGERVRSAAPPEGKARP